MSTITTVAPSWRKRVAVPSPIPWAPPVMIATLLYVSRKLRLGNTLRVVLQFLVIPSAAMTFVEGSRGEEFSGSWIIAAPQTRGRAGGRTYLKPLASQARLSNIVELILLNCTLSF